MRQSQETAPNLPASLLRRPMRRRPEHFTPAWRRQLPISRPHYISQPLSPARAPHSPWQAGGFSGCSSEAARQQGSKAAHAMVSTLRPLQAAARRVQPCRSRPKAPRRRGLAGRRGHAVGSASSAMPGRQGPQPGSGGGTGRGRQPAGAALASRPASATSGVAWRMTPHYPHAAAAWAAGLCSGLTARLATPLLPAAGRGGPVCDLLRRPGRGNGGVEVHGPGAVLAGGDVSAPRPCSSPAALSGRPLGAPPVLAVQQLAPLRRRPGARVAAAASRRPMLRPK